MSMYLFWFAVSCDDVTPTMGLLQVSDGLNNGADGSEPAFAQSRPLFAARPLGPRAEEGHQGAVRPPRALFPEAQSHRASSDGAEVAESCLIASDCDEAFSRLGKLFLPVS